MYDKQYIAFDRVNPEKPQLFSDQDELYKMICDEVREETYKHNPNCFTKIMEVEIEDFASVSGSWRDVTEDFYRSAEERVAA